MFSYACLMCNMDDIDYNIFLTSVDDTSVDASATVCEHPIITGDKVMDHMYRDADSVSLSGVFTSSENSIKINEEVPTLRKIQELFEKIKDNGILCKLVKFVPNKNQNDLFKVRENLVIERIHWGEGINSMSYSFSFKEIMLSETIDVDVDYADDSSPDIKEIVEKTFTESLFQSDKVMSVIVEYLKQEGMISDDFWNNFFSLSADNKGEWITGLAVGATTGLVVLASTGVGAVAALAGIAVGLAAYSIYKAIHKAVVDNRFKVKAFDEWSESEKNRFENLLNSLKDEMDKLNTVIKVYQLTSDDNQQIILSFSDEYLSLIFNKSNIDNSIVSVEAYDANDVNIKSISNISNYPNNFSELKTDSAVYIKDGNYLFIAYLGDENGRQKLSNYGVVITSMKPEEFFEAVIKLVGQYIYRM